MEIRPGCVCVCVCVGGDRSPEHLVDEALHLRLKTPPLELDRHQLVGTHPGAVRLHGQLLLSEGPVTHHVTK